MTGKEGHVVMHATHGAAAGRTCADCQFFVVSGSRPKPGSGTRLSIFGCRLFNKTHATRPAQWAGRWSACGAFKGVQ